MRIERHHFLVNLLLRLLLLLLLALLVYSNTTTSYLNFPFYSQSTDYLIVINIACLLIYP